MDFQHLLTVQFIVVLYLISMAGLLTMACLSVYTVCAYSNHIVLSLCQICVMIAEIGIGLKIKRPTYLVKDHPVSICLCTVLVDTSHYLHSVLGLLCLLSSAFPKSPPSAYLVFPSWSPIASTCVDCFLFSGAIFVSSL